MQDRGHLLTELRNERSQNVDCMEIPEAFDLINDEDATIALRVADEKPNICRAVELVVSAFRNGGRLIYLGAGTSGRLGVLDASECPPTFLSDPSMVQGYIAGGDSALRKAIEGAEDYPEKGAEEVDRLNVSENDVVFGIATGGTTPFVHGAINRANERGASSVFFACVSRDQVPDNADVSIRVLVGPEVVTGSTRMKAGTATKMVLNMVTTISMIQIGKVYENLMIDMNSLSNKKLVDRGTRIIMTLTGLSREEACSLLQSANGRVKAAIVMHNNSLSFDEAMDYLTKHGGRVRSALAS